MIPKRLIFIWLGSELPEYGKYCMQMFKEVNPDFEVMFVYEPDLGNVQNEDLKACIELVNSAEYNMYKHMMCRPWAVKNLGKSEVGKTTALSDAFRLYLLNKYGGIYLDLDTFPVKQFDDKLLQHSGFAVSHQKRQYDYFFMGFLQDCVKDGLIHFKVQYGKGQIFDLSKIYTIKYDEKMFNAFHFKRKQLVEKFVSGTLVFGESLFDQRMVKDYYIDHFRLGAWHQKT